MVDIIDWDNANNSAILNHLCFRSNLSPTGEKKRGVFSDLFPKGFNVNRTLRLIQCQHFGFLPHPVLPRRGRQILLPDGRKKRAYFMIYSRWDLMLIEPYIIQF